VPHVGWQSLAAWQQCSACKTSTVGLPNDVMMLFMSSLDLLYDKPHGSQTTETPWTAAVDVTLATCLFVTGCPTQQHNCLRN
jgi:hypothetical protein